MECCVLRGSGNSHEKASLLLPPGNMDLEALLVNSHFILHLSKRTRDMVAHPETNIPVFLLPYQMMRKLTVFSEDKG